MFIFIDESGQLTNGTHESYFIVGSFTVSDPRKSEKKFRAWHRTKFPKKIRHQPEIKFSDKNIDYKLKIQTLQFISQLDVVINYTYLRRDNIPVHYRNKGRIDSGHLYTHIIGETIEMYTPTRVSEFNIFCDQRHLKDLTRTKFKEILKGRLLPLLPAKAVLQIEMVDSTTSVNIQIADWINGAIAAYHNKKPNGEMFYAQLHKSIVGAKELFKEDWVEKQKTQSRD